MSLTIIITHPPGSAAAQKAEAYCDQHQQEIELVFFFAEGIKHALEPAPLWRELQEQHNCILCCCVDSVEQYASSSTLIASPFMITGMGKLAQSCDQTDSTVLF